MLKALLKSTNPVRTAVVHIVLIQVTMNEVPHENKVMLYRTTRQATELVKGYMGANVGPNPLDQKPF